MVIVFGDLGMVNMMVIVVFLFDWGWMLYVYWFVCGIGISECIKIMLIVYVWEVLWILYD